MKRTIGVWVCVLMAGVAVEAQNVAPGKAAYRYINMLAWENGYQNTYTAARTAMTNAGYADGGAVFVGRDDSPASIRSSLNEETGVLIVQTHGIAHVVGEDSKFKRIVPLF